MSKSLVIFCIVFVLLVSVVSAARDFGLAKEGTSKYSPKKNDLKSKKVVSMNYNLVAKLSAVKSAQNAKISVIKGFSDSSSMRKLSTTRIRSRSSLR